MKLFVDSANLKEIEDCLKRGIVKGVTTNPTLIAKEKHLDLYKHTESIINLLQRYNQRVPLSVELTTLNVPDMIQQGILLHSYFRSYKELVIKVPIGWTELEVITTLNASGVVINCTACMTYSQAVMAANAGASYVSLFWNRIKDAGVDPFEVVMSVHQTFKERNCPAQIIVGSIRQPRDVTEAWQAGADIVTVPVRFMIDLCSHPKTTEVIAEFMAAAWQTPKTP